MKHKKTSPIVYAVVAVAVAGAGYLAYRRWWKPKAAPSTSGGGGATAPTQNNPSPKPATGPSGPSYAEQAVNYLLPKLGGWLGGGGGTQPEPLDPYAEGNS